MRKGDLIINKAALAGLLLKTSERKLNYFLYKLTEDKRYETFSISKKNGGKREINTPIQPIKKWQKDIARYLEKYKNVNSVAHAYEKNKSIKTNADFHCGKKQRYVLRIDIKDFFPEINFGRVRGLFLSKPFNFNEEVATILAQICCYKGVLPQGAPSSPIISNLICRRLDRELLKFAKENRCRYTRYADDIFFSTDKRFSSKICRKIIKSEIIKFELSEEIKNIFLDNGFEINQEKVSFTGKEQRQTIAGIVVNEMKTPPRKFIRELRAMIHCWETKGEDEAKRLFLEKDKKNRKNKNINFPNVVKGKLEHIGNIRDYDKIYEKYAIQLTKIDPTFRINKKCKISSTEIMIHTEGKTDILHLQKALQFFQERGKFRNIKIKCESKENDSKLKNFCEQISKTNQSKIHICIFDRDDKSIIKSIIEGNQNYKKWDNKVYSLCMPVPKHRNSSDPFCIELYYPDEILKKTNKDGRRIFQKSEFDKDGILKENINIKERNPDKKTLIVEKVLDGRKSVAMSKDGFSKAIYNSQEPFEKINFSPFEILFLEIEKIISH